MAEILAGDPFDSVAHSMGDPFPKHGPSAKPIWWGSEGAFEWPNGEVWIIKDGRWECVREATNQNASLRDIRAMGHTREDAEHWKKEWGLWQAD